MKTKLWPMEGDGALAAAEEGGRLLRAGQLVAFPTETVYGLGANALDDEAVRRIFEAKGRPADNPLIAHVTCLAEAEKLAFFDHRARALAEAFWPGPLTLVLPKKPVVPEAVTAGLPTVAIRTPDHPGALALIRAAGVPVAAPSANRSGRPSPTTAADVLEDMEGRVPLILDGGPCRWGLESTVLRLGDAPMILRPGAVTPAMLAPFLGAVAVAGSALQPLAQGETAQSPGMKYRHYAPKAHVVMAAGEGAALAQNALELASALEAQGKSTLLLATAQTAALYAEAGRPFEILGDREDVPGLCAALFHALREADRRGYGAVVLEALPPEALGLAYMNRALRAAAFRLGRL